MGEPLVIDSYLIQLSRMAQACGVRLLDAFLEAGIPDSTYYRATRGKTDLRLQTAQQVADALRRRRSNSSP